ncbi:MAG: arsenate-mycothiol transferase ArsC [Candidatus Bathyarchaeaceae archaeon]
MKILFVCTGNSYRSPVAEALLKKIQGDLKVESAGTQPAGMIASNAKKFLERENALEKLKRMPEGIDEKNLEEYDLIVAMKQNHKNEILRRFPQMEDRIEVWNIDDPIYLPYGSDEEVFEEIKRKVIELAKSISK